MAAPSIWILNHYAGTPDAPGPTRHIDLATRLVARGFRVTLVASSRRSIRGDAEHPAHGCRASVYEGVHCNWLRSKVRARGNDSSRVANMLEFAFRLWREGRSRFGGQAPYPDVIVGSTPHLFTPLVGWLLARRFRARFVVEVRDLWPETFVAFGFYGPRHPIVLALRGLERFLYRRADRIVTLLPEAWRYFVERAGVTKEDVAWIPNGAAVSGSPAGERPANRPFTFMYMGSEGRANVLDDLLTAAGILQEEGSPLRVVLVGDGKERARLEEEAQTLSLQNVAFVDAVPKRDVARLLPEADAFVALLEKTPLYRYGISLNKLFEYMAAGKPVLLAGETAHNYVALAECGLVIPPRDPEALARAMAELAALSPAERAEMGQRGREYARAHHDWDLLAARFAGVPEDVIARGVMGPRRERTTVVD